MKQQEPNQYKSERDFPKNSVEGAEITAVPKNCPRA